MTKEVIIVGGGTSLRPYLPRLNTALQNKFVIACNYSYRYIPHTLMCFVDHDLYQPSLAKIAAGQYQNVTEELKNLPLIVGKYHQAIDEKRFNNTFLIKPSGEYQGHESYTKGFYNPCLCGLFSISLSLYSIDYAGVIYLLGYDWTKDSPNTHFYDDIKHRGMGYTSFYERNNPDHYFKPFLTEKNVQIYNVSPNSNINTFPKIEFAQFFSMLSPEAINQEDLRNQLRSKYVHCNV